MIRRQALSEQRHLVVQAHSLPFSYESGATTVNVPSEGGQLLYLKVAGS